MTEETFFQSSKVLWCGDGLKICLIVGESGELHVEEHVLSRNYPFVYKFIGIEYDGNIKVGKFLRLSGCGYLFRLEIRLYTYENKVFGHVQVWASEEQQDAFPEPSLDCKWEGIGKWQITKIE